MKASDVDISGLDDDEALSLAIRLSEDHGFSGTYFTRDDAEDRAGRAFTEEEWKKVQGTWAWKKGLQELLCERGWEIVDDALQDAGIQKEESDDEDQPDSHA